MTTSRPAVFPAEDKVRIVLRCPARCDRWGRSAERGLQVGQDAHGVGKRVESQRYRAGSTVDRAETGIAELARFSRWDNDD